MPSWAGAGSAAVEVLGSATAGASDHSLTVSFTAVTDATPEVYVTFMGSMDAQKDLMMKINGLTSDYWLSRTGFTQTTGTTAQRALYTSASEWTLSNQYLNKFFSGWVKLSIRPNNPHSSESSDILGNYQVGGDGSASEGNEWYGCMKREGVSSLTSVTLEMGGAATDYFADDTILAVYKRSA